MFAKKNTRKVVILLAALMLLVGCAIGGTMAWLIAQSNTVTNTFTVGNITLSLDESGATAAEGQTDKTMSLKMIPGAKIAKDPKVTVGANSEACWLFVEVTKSSNLDTFITYNVNTASGQWTAVEGTDNVYYRKVSASAVAQDFYILTGEGNDTYKNGFVTVKDSVTKANMESLSETNAVQPSLAFKAYAIQSEGLTTGEGENKTNVQLAKDAWALVKPAGNP